LVIEYLNQQEQRPMLLHQNNLTYSTSSSSSFPAKLRSSHGTIAYNHFLYASSSRLDEDRLSKAWLCLIFVASERFDTWV
jgi:hypothetical protein